jgi:hypothetical protein
MTLTDLTNEVYTLTGRPDRVTETLSAIRSATLKLHQCDFFYKDLYETGIQFNTSDYLQQLDYRALFPLFRAVKYIRKYDYVNSAPGKELSRIDVDNLFDQYNVTKTDVYYVGGAYLNINSCDQQQYYLIGIYQNPNITVANYNSWIALDHPYAIVFDAAATVFKAIGKDDEAAAYRNLVVEQIAMLKGSNIIPEGY